MKRLLYLFGEPGTGKITVARILQERLDWKLFWLHDLDTVCEIVGKYPLPRLMDTISLAVLEELMANGQDIIYVRPSRDLRTREGVRALACINNYAVYSIHLWANYDTLVERVENRRNGSKFRVRSRDDLDFYLGSRHSTMIVSGECLVNTDNTTPEKVADTIQDLVQFTAPVMSSANS